MRLSKWGWLVMLTVVSALACPGWSEPARAGSVQAFSADIAGTEVVFLDGAVVVEKRPGYRVKINSAELVPVKGNKNSYGTIRRVGGVNEGKTPLKLATFIPLSEYREQADPAHQVLWVKVNGVERPAWVFWGAANQPAIDLLKKSFPGNPLLQTQIEARTPNLFIPLGLLAPGKEILLEYELAPRSGIKVN